MYSILKSHRKRNYSLRWLFSKCYNGVIKLKEFAMIGKNIKSLRKTHDLTQPEFARIVGISRNSLSRYENGT
ncbi:helix-turn-helix transcriptional regulator, partial [Streptococcus pneumoniae]